MLTVAGDASIQGVMFAKAFLVPNLALQFASSGVASAGTVFHLPSEVLTEDGQSADLYQMGVYALGQVLSLADRNHQAEQGADAFRNRILSLEDNEERIASSTESVSLIESVRKESLRIVMEVFVDQLSRGYEPLTELVAIRMTAIQGYFEKVYAQELCINEPDGTEECISERELKELLEMVPTQSVGSQTVVNLETTDTGAEQIIEESIDISADILPVVDPIEQVDQVNEEVADPTNDLVEGI